MNKKTQVQIQAVSFPPFNRLKFDACENIYKMEYIMRPVEKIK